MTINIPRRPETAAKYKTFVNRAVVTALRSVYTDQYPDKQFRNLPIYLQYPQEKIQYPIMIVRFVDQNIQNAGVGHQEWAFDANGLWQKWYHYRFEGTLEFHLYTLSSLDQDIMADTLIELIAFGKLQDLTDQFYQQIFDEYNNGGQLMLQTDMITSMGVSVGKPFWEPEDTLLYQGGYQIVCHGAFYSTGNTELAAFLDHITVLPYIDGEPVPAGDIEVDVPWPGGNTWTDMGQVSLQAAISADTT